MDKGKGKEVVRVDDSKFTANMLSKDTPSRSCWIQPMKQDSALGGFAGSQNMFKVKITLFPSHVAGPHFSITVNMTIDSFVTESARGNEHNMQFRYNRHLLSRPQLLPVRSDTRLPTVMVNCEKTQEMIKKGELYMLHLYQDSRADFGIMTEVNITEPSVIENLRVLRLLAQNPSVIVYVRKTIHYDVYVQELCDLIKEYREYKLKPYHSFFYGKNHSWASTTYKQMHKLAFVDQTPRSFISAFEDIESYRLVMGYGHWFDATYLEAAALEMSQTPIKAVFLKHTDTKSLMVFMKPDVAEDNKLLQEGDKIGYVTAPKKNSFREADEAENDPSNPIELDDEDDVPERDDEQYSRGHILPRSSSIPVHLVSNRAGEACFARANFS